MTFNLAGTQLLFLLPTLLWWGLLAYLILRVVRAIERGVRAHEDVARELARLVSEMRAERSRSGE